MDPAYAASQQAAAPPAILELREAVARNTAFQKKQAAEEKAVDKVGASFSVVSLATPAPTQTATPAKTEQPSAAQFL